jgi:hypothetical protein
MLRSTKESRYISFDEIWYGQGFEGEPLVDSARIESDDILSIFTITKETMTTPLRNVVVLDFAMPG